MNSDKIAKVSKTTGLPELEINIILRRFMQLDKSGEGILSKDELITGLHGHPFAEVLYERLPKAPGTGLINADSFVMALAIFGKTCPIKNKLRFVYTLFLNGEEKTLTRASIKTVVSILMPSLKESDNKIDLLVKAMNNGAEDGKVTLPQFVEYMMKLPGIQQLLTIEFSRELFGDQANKK